MAMKPIMHYEGLYSITEDGKVWSHRGKKFLAQRGRNGYLSVCLYKDGKPKTFSVHRLVAETFIPNTENKPQVNHKNGNKQDNRVSNLEWVTPSENGVHATKMGLSDPSLSNKNGLLSGEGNGRSKLTWQDVHSMRMNCESIKMGESPWKKYGISETEYNYIIRNKTWVLEPPYWSVNARIPLEYTGEDNPNAKLTWEEIKEIRRNHPNRSRGEKTWKKYGISQGHYWKIISKKTWRN